LDHVGYDGDQTAKHARNEPILRKALEDDPKRAYCWFHLAVTLDAMQRQDEALTCAETALQLARQSPHRDEHIVGSSCCQFLAESALRRHEPARAIDLAKQGLGLCSDNFALSLVLANGLLAAGEANPAIAIAADLLDVDPEALVHDGLAFDMALFRRDAHGVLAECYFELGQYSQADEHFALAEKHGANPFETKVKRALCESMGKMA